MRRAANDTRNEIHTAVENDDFDAFLKAIEDTPLADIILTVEDFAVFKDAHELREEGEFLAAQELFNELGVERRGHSFVHQQQFMHAFAGMSHEQRDALRVARQSNDRETVRAILEEAGFEDRW